MKSKLLSVVTATLVAILALASPFSVALDTTDPALLAACPLFEYNQIACVRTARARATLVDMDS